MPAEKFEEERRALYASLLKPDSPKTEEGEETTEISSRDQEEPDMALDESSDNLLIREDLDTSVEEGIYQIICNFAF